MEIYLKLINDLITITRKMFEKMSAICAEEDIHHLNPHQIYIICHIKPNRQYTVGELANIYPLSNISYNLICLENQDYLKKEQNLTDLRHTMITLTPKGEKLYELIKAKLKDNKMNTKQNFIKEINTLTMEIKTL